MRNPLIRAAQATDLSAPVGMVMRPTLTVETVDSLARAAQTLRENGATLLPVVDEGGRLTGVLTDAGLATALAEMSEPTDAVGPFAERAETLAPYATAAEALRWGGDGKTRVVVDDAGRPVGLISALDLWPRRRTLPRPATVGGMATPFGVYLTTGNVSAGAPWWALMATGASMMLMATAGQVAATFAMGRGLSADAAPYLGAAVFFLLLRLFPLSGTHGAEHQVVNAIEREETLTADVVRRDAARPPPVRDQPDGRPVDLPRNRRHPLDRRREAAGDRGAGRGGGLRPSAGFGGAKVRHHAPAERSSARGRHPGGEALLQANATARHSRSHPLRRIWHMGLLQVMAGATLATALLGLIKLATGLAWLPDIR